MWPASQRGIFKYLLTVTRDATNKADVIITALEDVVRSSTDTSVYGAFNLHSSSDQVSGNLTLLGSDEDYTCDDLTLPATLSTTAPGLSCVLVMKVSDEDLPDDARPTPRRRSSIGTSSGSVQRTFGRAGRQRQV